MFRLPFHRLIWTGVLLSWLLAGSGFAQVSADQKAAAEALFDRGLELMRQGEYSQACAYLEQSQTIERGIGAMLYLAECYEKLGRTASAWALFREASSAAKAEGQFERSQQGLARASQLEPQLAKLTLLVPAGSHVPGLEIARNGVLVPSAVWGLPVPVDPGPQRIEVRAPGYEAWSHTEQVGKGAQQSVSVPPLQAAATPAPSAVPVSTPAPVPPAAIRRQAEQSAAPRAPDKGATWQRTAGLVTGGVGLAALAVGTYFGVRAASKNSDAQRFCPGGGSVCTSNEGLMLTDEAQSSATLANVFVFGGAALAATGVVLYLAAPDEDTPVIAVSAQAGGAGLWLAGAL
jgi:hypothetical protein